eukprot:snap_masked-scaffold5_size1054832-processed-gene-4.3 protein:Tk04035 transcript:snap_masked-scaffold5_size1054832-processed-gene-4.3-mRNA-1 annotation:"bile acid receptor-like isoform x8"
MKAKVEEVWAAMDPAYVNKVCRAFRPRLEAMVEAGGDHFETYSGKWEASGVPSVIIGVAFDRLTNGFFNVIGFLKVSPSSNVDIERARDASVQEAVRYQELLEAKAGVELLLWEFHVEMDLPGKFLVPRGMSLAIVDKVREEVPVERLRNHENPLRPDTHQMPGGLESHGLLMYCDQNEITDQFLAEGDFLETGHDHAHVTFDETTFVMRELSGAYRRSESSKLVCQYGGTCEITPKSRRNCAKCRFDQCIGVGMKVSLVLDESQKQQRFRRSLKKKRGQEAEGPSLDGLKGEGSLNIYIRQASDERRDEAYFTEDGSNKSGTDVEEEICQEDLCPDIWADSGIQEASKRDPRSPVGSECGQFEH